MAIIPTQSGDKTFYEQLNKLIKLPPHCHKLQLNMEIGRLVELKIEYYAEYGDLTPITETFNLVKIEPETDTESEPEGEKTDGD